MNRNWQRCFELVRKKERIIIGLMSGTSLDGLDIALCSISGSGMGTKVKLLKFCTVPYGSALRDEMKTVISRRDTDLQLLTLLNAKIGNLHARLVLETLQKWEVAPEGIDVIASHGQTVFHAPASLHGLDSYPNATLQIGDGDHIAVGTGILTISDFRQKHIAAGGEGAPLAVYGDYFLFSDEREDRVMLNIGGIANFTFLPRDGNTERIFSTDIGPGNTLMDQYVQRHFEGFSYDRDSVLAHKGNHNEALLDALLDAPFFKRGFPKTTGPELFSMDYLQRAQERSRTGGLAKEDVLATLNRFTAEVVAEAIGRCFDDGSMPVIYLSGGGMHNPLLRKNLEGLLPGAIFRTTAELGIDPDAKEAVLFALLANEMLAGEATGFRRQGIPMVAMGKVSFPF